MVNKIKQLDEEIDKLNKKLLQKGDVLKKEL